MTSGTIGAFSTSASSPEHAYSGILVCLLCKFLAEARVATAAAAAAAAAAGSHDSCTRDLTRSDATPPQDDTGLVAYFAILSKVKRGELPGWDSLPPGAQRDMDEAVAMLVSFI